MHLILRFNDAPVQPPGSLLGKHPCVRKLGHIYREHNSTYYDEIPKNYLQIHFSHAQSQECNSVIVTLVVKFPCEFMYIVDIFSTY